jgi:hypothetical protein
MLCSQSLSGCPTVHLVSLDSPHGIRGAYDPTHTLDAPGMAGVRNEHHKPDLTVRSEVGSEMFVSIRLPLSAKCGGRRDGHRRATEFR